MRKHLIAFSVGLMAAGLAGPSAAESDKPDELPPVLQDLSLPDVEVEKRFETEIPGIVGWAVTAKGDKNLIYTTKDGEHAILGMLLGRDGKNITEQHSVEHLGKKPGGLASQKDSGMDPEKVLTAMQEAPFHVEEGTGDKVIYATFDPECPHCARYYQNTRDMLDEYTIRWVPVAMLAPSSLEQAAALVEADYPAKALARLEGGELSVGSVSDKAKRTIRQNSARLQEAGVRATPVTAFEDADGQPQVIRGAADARRLGAAY